MPTAELGVRGTIVEQYTVSGLKNNEQSVESAVCLNQLARASC